MVTIVKNDLRLKANEIHSTRDVCRILLKHLQRSFFAEIVKGINYFCYKVRVFDRILNTPKFTVSFFHMCFLRYVYLFSEETGEWE